MIRQFGLPTFFITLSVAESKWNELLVILSLLLDSRDITEEEAAALSSAEKATLIRSDPVTFSRYFDCRFRQLMKLFKSSEIFGESTIIGGSSSSTEERRILMACIGFLVPQS